MVLLRLLALFVGCSAVLFLTGVCTIVLSVSILGAYGLYYLVDYIFTVTGGKYVEPKP